MVNNQAGKRDPNEVDDDEDMPSDMQVWNKFSFRQRTLTDNSLNPVYNLSQFQEKVDLILAEFFRSHEAADAADALNELDCSRMMDEFVVRAVRKSLEIPQAQLSTEKAQEMTSGLFRLLHVRKALDSAQLARGFDKLSLTYDDLALDLPTAPLSILVYVDTAVNDQCLDADHVARLPEPFLRALSETTATAGAEVAKNLRTVLAEIQEFKRGAERVAEDAVAGANATEVTKAINELKMPHLRHEVVRKMVQISFSKTERARRAVAKLLADLRANETLSDEHVAVGLTRIVGTLDDLLLDYPAAVECIRKFWAYAVLEELVAPAALQAVARLRIGGPRGVGLVKDVEQWTTDPLVTANSLWADEVDAMRLNEFRQALMLAIREYFDAVDAPEFARIIRKLDLDEEGTTQRVEVVRKIVGGALDRSAKDCHAAVALLQYLVEQGDLKHADLVMALGQLRERLPDLKLDVPDAEPILDAFDAQLLRP